MSDERCQTCGASLTSPLTVRNLPDYPLCPNCGAVTDIRRVEPQAEASETAKHKWELKTDPHRGTSELVYPGDKATTKRYTFDDWCEPCITAGWCSYHGGCLAERDLPHLAGTPAPPVERGFCRACGAGIPPRMGEGTCPRCDPPSTRKDEAR